MAVIYNWRTVSLYTAVLLGFARMATAAGLPAAEPATPGYTSGDVILLAVYILLALVFSFLCSVAEAVLLSITPSFIAGLREQRPKLAKLLEELKQDKVDQSLAAILTLNTIAHTVGAIGSGAKATVVFGSAWFGLFSAVMTLMILFLSEIIPKTIGAVYWRSLAGVTARFVRLLIWVLFPLIWISETLTRLVAGDRQAHVFSREEFIAMAGVGERSGKIDPHESRIIRNLLRLGALTARDIMTPRTVISALPQTMTVAEAMAVEPAVTFSRLPIHTNGLDYVTGFILRNDLLLASSDNRRDRTLDSLKREITAVPGNIPLTKLFDYMLDRRQHIALVVDEHGGTQGLVTTEDVLETILGLEIVDETDHVEDMQVLARQQWRKRAAAMGVAIPEEEPAPKLD